MTVVPTGTPAFLLGAMALEVAVAELGRGEHCDHGANHNNCGPDVRKYRGDKLREPWCAAFVYWCFREAAEASGQRLPFGRSNNARRLAARIEAAGGRRVTTPAPGDVALFSRGLNPFAGHICFVRSAGTYVWFSIDGNRGGYPSVVDEFKHVMGEPGLLRFIRI